VEDFSRCRRPHFVGIGGAGQSALARLLLARGLPVSGSDLRSTPVTRALADEGATVFLGHAASNLGHADWVITTDAAPADNAELVAAKKRGIPVWRRSALLGWLMAQRRGIAVTGTHGKSTTAALLGAMLEAGGFDPTVVVGAEVKAYGGNVRTGGGEWFVAEACEAYDAMHDLLPECAILTSLEADHLDHHKTLEGLVESMSRFVERLPEGGLLVYPATSETCDRVASRAHCETVTFGLEQGDCRAIRIDETPDGCRFDAEFKGERLGSLSTPETGLHSVLNALAAFATARSVGCEAEAASSALASFGGVAQRLENRGDHFGVTFVDDYAHHPTEIRAAIQALRQRYPGRRLVVVYQPHLYSRTRDFLHGFAEALAACDALVLTDIYPAREAPIPGVSSGRIAELVEWAHPGLPVLYVPALGEVPEQVAPVLREGDVLVAMGAGEANQVLEVLPELLARRRRKDKPVIAVLAGGSSAEREVSRTSGIRVSEALREKGFEVREFDPSVLRDRIRGISAGALGHAPALGESGTPQLPADLGVQPPEPERRAAEVAFIALHGTVGEDGSMQGLLEVAGIPYTGSGILASALAMDKYRSKRVLTSEGIPVVPGVLLGRNDWRERLGEVPLPAVVKPNAQGSSVGLRIAETPEELRSAVDVAFHYDHQVLVEPRLSGIEVSACVLGNDRPEVLPLVEIVPEKGVYDYEAKYTPGATEEIVPARIPEDAAKECARVAALSHVALGCAGFSRVDMMLTDDGPLVLEVNTVPGLTPTSIFPRSAEAAGMSFGDLCERLVELALEAHDARRPAF
jgi:UDP-N-acetylmuramate--alanine ligase